MPLSQAAPSAEEPIDLVTPTGTIHGTLLRPSAAGAVPVALLIAGSGPTDRNGNSAILPGPNNSLELLAEGLARQGIATVRYDKRGVAASAAAITREADLRFDHYTDDAVAWIAKLKTDPRFSRVSVIGHSEGSLIGIRAARVGGAASFVSLAGVGRRASDVLRGQLRPQLPPALWTESERILAALEAGRTADSVPQPLAALYRPSVQPYLISWFAYDPAREIAELRIPVLIAQGTTDIQVGVPDAQALEAAKPDADLLIVEGMNHVLKLVPADPAKQQASYADPSLPVAPQLIERIGAFLKATRP
jgi:pimeloyl-ACP methyl ester carboxylesterase